MSVYIPGMEIPRERCEAVIIVHKDGSAYIAVSPEVGEVGYFREYPLVHVPPHGRLICDRDVKWAFDDAILDEAQKTGQVRATSDEVASVINAIPTIIPAEEGE